MSETSNETLRLLEEGLKAADEKLMATYLPMTDTIDYLFVKAEILASIVQILKKEKES